MDQIRPKHNSQACQASVLAVKDALYVLSGKWKLPLLLVLSEGPQRFKDIQRSLGEITPKVLSKELRELELNEFVTRTVMPTVPVSVTYELTPYSETLDKVIAELRNWGLQHRERIVKSRKAKVVAEELGAT